MKKHIAILLLSTSLLCAPTAHAFKTGNPGADNAASSTGNRSQAKAMLDMMNGNGAFARDLYRNTFMQIMGLVFFDPNTPDIKACQKEVMNYHLPELTRTNLDYTLIGKDVAQIYAQVYSKEELQWMSDFYSSPFGKRMLSKQLQVNERITRDIANKYGKLKPEFSKMYGIVAERCGGITPSASMNEPKIGSELLSVPGLGTAPLPPSPEPGRP